MDSISILLGVALIWAIAAVTPGPNFFITVQVAAAQSSRLGLMTVAGITSGTAIWGLAGFLGVSALFVAAPWLYATFKLIGGAYLIYLGLRLIRRSFQSPAIGTAPATTAQRTQVSAWRLGLLTNLSNVKTAAFVTSLFATTMPAEPSLALGLAAVVIMVAISVAWYSAVALVFASPVMRHGYTTFGHLIDRVAGGIFVLFGAKLAFDR